MVETRPEKEASPTGTQGGTRARVRAEAARLALKAGMMEGQPKDLSDGPQATLARALGAAFGTRTLGSNLLRGVRAVRGRSGENSTREWCPLDYCVA